MTRNQNEEGRTCSKVGGEEPPTSSNCEGSSYRARRPAPDESLCGCGNRGERHWSDPQPTPKPGRQGVRFNDYIAVAGSTTPAEI
jgi:hypothetical protein